MNWDPSTLTHAIVAGIWCRHPILPLGEGAGGIWGTGGIFVVKRSLGLSMRPHHLPPGDTDQGKSFWPDCGEQVSQPPMAFVFCPMGEGVCVNRVGYPPSTTP